LNLFSKTFLARNQLKLLFVVIWLHISLLDLVFFTYRGSVFLWQENIQLLTLFVHFSIALATTTVYWLINKFLTRQSVINKFNAVAQGESDMYSLDKHSSNITKNIK